MVGGASDEVEDGARSRARGEDWKTSFVRGKPWGEGGPGARGESAGGRGGANGGLKRGEALGDRSEGVLDEAG